MSNLLHKDLDEIIEITEMSIHAQRILVPSFQDCLAANSHIINPFRGKSWTLGIDPATDTSGFTLYDYLNDYSISFNVKTQKIVHNGYTKKGKEKTKKEKMWGTERNRTTAIRLATILSVFLPKYIAMEGYSMSSKGLVYDIGEFGGLLRTVLQHYLDHNDEAMFVEVPPTSLKTIATDRTRNIDKKDMVWFANKRFGGLFTDAEHDMAESYILSKVPLLMLNKELLHKTIELPKTRQKLEELKFAEGDIIRWRLKK